jgi:hypothetical protein
MRGLFTLIAMVLLAGCSNDAPSASSVPAVPPLIETMMAKDFPADGQIYVESRGAFVVNNDTMFCRHLNGLMVQPEAANKLFKKLGQPATLKGGYPRVNGKVGVDRECDLPDQMFVKGEQTTNRQGKPYKLVLAVWQGDPSKGGAYWVGGVERLEGEHLPNPDILHPIEPPANYKPDKRQLISGSISADISDLSEKFVTDVKGTIK